MLIITLKFLVPRIFTGLESTLLVFFETVQNILASGSKYQNTAGFFPQI